jgi:hypothetical protein
MSSTGTFAPAVSQCCLSVAVARRHNRQRSPGGFRLSSGIELEVPELQLDRLHYAVNIVNLFDITAADSRAITLNETANLSKPLAANDLVSEIWERTFGIPADRGDHLLDVLVNGSGRARSVQVGELFDELAVATGVQLPVLVALESPTAADLAQMVCSRDRPTLKSACPSRR